MSITRLQQARQMYALGQRVGGIMGSNNGSMLVTPTRDGSRPGYYGPDAGHENDPGHGSNSGNNGGGDRHNPHTDSGYSKSSPPSSKSYDNPNPHRDPPNVEKAYEIIGGKKYEVTPDTKTERELAKVKQSILDAPLPNLTKKGTEYYDPNTGTLIGFAPTNKNPFSLKNIATNVVLGIVAPQLLGTKFATGMKAYNTAKTLSGLAKDIGLTDKNVLESFTSNLTDSISGFGKGTSKGTTSTNNNNNGGKGDGEGIASLDNQASGYDEYILLLQKLQSGNISDSERNRFNVLKNMLGI